MTWNYIDLVKLVLFLAEENEAMKKEKTSAIPSKVKGRGIYM